MSLIVYDFDITWFWWRGLIAQEEVGDGQDVLFDFDDWW